MSVKCFRVVTGEEILVEIIEEKDDIIIFKNPIAMVQTPSNELAGVHWLPLSAPNQQFTMLRSHILLPYEPNQEVINNYRQQTGGIVVASAGTLNQLPGQPK